MGSTPRVLNEVRGFSADVFSYWTSPAQSWLWGSLIRAYPKAEGDLFPTIAALLLGAVGVSWQHVARVGSRAGAARGRVAERCGRSCG